MPSSRSARKTRIAISPRFATRTLVKRVTAGRILHFVTLADQLTLAPAAPVPDKALVMAPLIVLIPVPPAWMVAVIVAREFLVSGLRLAALERGVVVSARDLSKLKTWAQSVAAGLGGLAAAGAFSDDVAWWGLLAALVLTLVSVLVYPSHAP